MKTVLLAVILLQCSICCGQNLSFYAGVNGTVFHNAAPGSGHFYSNYQSGLGYTVGIHLDSLKSYWWNIPLSIQFERYGASLEAQDGGLGGTYGVDTRVDKSVLALRVLPLHFNFKRKLHVNFGLQFSLLLKEKIQGTYFYWLGGQVSQMGDAADQYPRYSRSTYAGAIGQVSYDLIRTKNLVLAPQYGYYFGFSSEFREFPKRTIGMRHFLGIQIRRN